MLYHEDYRVKMFHPLVENLKKLKDQDIDDKIADLNKKYVIASRMSQPSVCEQIITLLATYKDEQRRRQFEATQALVKKQNKDLDDLINVE